MTQEYQPVGPKLRSKTEWELEVRRMEATIPVNPDDDDFTYWATMNGNGLKDTEIAIVAFVAFFIERLTYEGNIPETNGLAIAPLYTILGALAFARVRTRDVREHRSELGV